jgi:hypothetical protein
MLDFVKGHVFDPADFVIRTDGVCRLNPKLARMVVAKVSMSKVHGCTAGADRADIPQGEPERHGRARGDWSRCD